MNVNIVLMGTYSLFKYHGIKFNEYFEIFFLNLGKYFSMIFSQIKRLLYRIKDDFREQAIFLERPLKALCLFFLCWK